MQTKGKCVYIAFLTFLLLSSKEKKKNSSVSFIVCKNLFFIALKFSSNAIDKKVYNKGCHIADMVIYLFKLY